MKTLWKLCKVLLLSVFFTIMMLLGGVMQPVSAGVGKGLTALQTTAEDLRFLEEAKPIMLLRSLDGVITLYQGAPLSKERFTMMAGDPVRVLEFKAVANLVWALVAPLHRPEHGWVQVELLMRPRGIVPQVKGVAFCTGNAREPSSTCGADLPLNTQGIWVQYDYDMLQMGDFVQHVVVVNGERFQKPPFRVGQMPLRGRHQFNLLTHQPRLEAGQWMVQTIVNGRVVSELYVQLY